MEQTVFSITFHIHFNRLSSPSLLLLSVSTSASATHTCTAFTCRSAERRSPVSCLGSTRRFVRTRARYVCGCGCGQVSAGVGVGAGVGVWVCGCECVGVGVSVPYVEEQLREYFEIHRFSFECHQIFFTVLQGKACGKPVLLNCPFSVFHPLILFFPLFLSFSALPLSLLSPTGPLWLHGRHGAQHRLAAVHIHGQHGSRPGQGTVVCRRLSGDSESGACD